MVKELKLFTKNVCHFRTAAPVTEHTENVRVGQYELDISAEITKPQNIKRNSIAVYTFSITENYTTIRRNDTTQI